MPLLSGKDAILSAARRIAELGDDALDEDLLDAELALAGPVRDEDEAFAEAPGEGEPPLRPEDLGLPPRLSAWLARHGGRDVRRAFGAAARAARRLVPDADGHVALGRAAGASGSASAVGARPRYAPLEERVVPLSEAAAPTPRAFEHVPSADRERREALKREARSAEAWRRDPRRAKEVDPKTIDNAAVSATIKNLIAAGARREREADLPKGAGPAGRHEPTTRADERTSVPSVMGVSLFAGENDARTEASKGRLLPRGLASALLVAATDASPRRRLAGAERRAAANALLGRLPAGERPVIATGLPSRLQVPRATRQATLDALVAAALAAEAEARGVAPDAAFASMSERWLAARPKTRRRAIAAGVAAEARVFEAAASAVAYRGLAANALRSAVAVSGRRDARAEATRGGDLGDEGTVIGAGDASRVARALDPDARSVVPSAARERKRRGGENAGLAVADEAAVAVAVAFEREGFERTRERNRGVGGVAAARAGSLLQNYKSENADGVDLRAAATIPPLGASVSFWTETARTSNPKRPRSSRVATGSFGGSVAIARSRRGAAKSSARRSLASYDDDGDGRSAKPERRERTDDANERRDVFAAAASRDTQSDTNACANAAVTRAVRSLVRSFLEPFVDIGTITATFARSIETKATEKVIRKKRDEPDASFLRREKEKEAVKALTREYVRRGEKARRDRAEPEARKRARESEKKTLRSEADPVGTPNPPPPTFDFDVDDL